MTTIVEKRSDRDVIFGFMTVVFALVAWRGWGGARVLAIVFAVAAVATAVFWIWYRRQPLSRIVVTPDAITAGVEGQPQVRIERSPAAVLTFRTAGSAKHRTWWLVRADDPHSPGISMMGFRPQEVGPACREHGWVFAEGSLF